MTALLLIQLSVPAFVYLTNREAVVHGPTILPGLRPWDVISMLWDTIIFLVPFLMARHLLNRPEDLRMILKVLVGAAVVYSPLVLFELRMSPQLNNWVYGYFPHEWIQHVRGGGYRPLVFLRHGLVLGLFLLMAVLAACILIRRETSKQRLVFILAAGWLFLILLMSRNLGASLLAFLFVPVILFLGARLQLLISAIIALAFLCYPILRQADIVPIDRFTSAVQTISPERARSFSIRLNNEQALLERALQKPLFGWGGYGRGRVFNEQGRDVSITDGRWTIVLGTYGFVGYLSFFGLLALPLFWMVFKGKRLGDPPVVAGFAIFIAANLVDLIPNSELSPIGMMMVGALAGFVQRGPVERSDAAAEAPQRRQPSRYTRFERSSPLARQRPKGITRPE